MKSSQVAPRIGQAMKMSHIGRSAISEVWFQPKEVNCTPHHRNTIAVSSMNSDDTRRRIALARGLSSGQTSTSKCVPSRTATIAPSITIQMKKKRAISSVQM